MSFSKPVLVSDALAQKKLVEDNRVGLVHLEKDPADFAEKVLQLFKNKQKAIELGKNGKEFIENKFSWKHTSKELLKLYANL